MPSNEKIYYDALARIARGYDDATKLKNDPQYNGLEYWEVLEMGYDNLQAEAERAIKGKVRPSS